MAPGVGKTYAMLEMAIQQAERNVDVLIGVAESHNREDTRKLIDRLPSLPLKTVSYRGTEIKEFDLAEALREKPELIIVDELAHTNAPGMRHKKRYQDVRELLNAGINVYTTLNVQHLESRSDTVHEITSSPVRETVPDSILTEADSIQLVDISPVQLRERLKEGKVYREPQAATALNHFFKESNLIALRELSLRIMAEKVDHELNDTRTASGEQSIWKTSNRLMVAVGPSPFSARLVKWTSRMAYALNAPWIALSVDTGTPFSTEQQHRLDANLELARQLGAEVIVMPGRDLADTLLRMAYLRNVTQIVVGKPQQSYLWGLVRPVSLVDKLVKGSDRIDIYVVPAPESKGSRNKKIAVNIRNRDLPVIGVTVGLLTVTGLLISRYTGYFAPGLVYLAGIVLMGFLIHSKWMMFLAAALCAALWNLLFISPTMTFRIGRVEDIVLCVLFFVVALLAGGLTSMLHVRERNEREREERTNSLFLYSRAIAATHDEDSLINRAVSEMSRIMDVKLNLFREDPANGNLTLYETEYGYPTGEKERSVALWCFQHREHSGKYTDTLPMADGYYLPMMSGQNCMGVIGIVTKDEERLSSSQRDLLENMVGQLAMALEREQLKMAKTRAEMAEESEKLYHSLMDSVSHEFKTPLAVIEGCCEKLSANTMLGATDAENCREMATATRRLRRLVKNLLDMTRIESGSLKPRMDWCDVNDIVENALTETSEVRNEHPTTLEIPSDFPLVMADFSLMEHVVVNLLLNACIHTPPGTHITLKGTVDVQKQHVLLDISDDGPGIPPERADNVFDRFVTTRPGGVGLGLSIVKGFMKAQKGSVSLVPVDAGTCFRLIMPLIPYDRMEGPEEGND